MKVVKRLEGFLVLPIVLWYSVGLCKRFRDCPWCQSPQYTKSGPVAREVSLGKYESTP